MRSALLRCLIVGALALFGLGGPASAGVTQPPPVTATRTTLTAPDAAATDFGRGFAMDEQRVVASAALGAGRVVYVFDRQPDGRWAHSATIPAPAGASGRWGDFVAVAGGYLAVGDPGYVRGTANYGRVHVHKLGASGWVQVQVLQVPGEFRTFAAGVWMTGDALLVRDAGYCDASCSYGRTLLYERGLIAPYQLRSDSGFVRPSLGLTVGVDTGRIATGVPGFVDPFQINEPTDSVLSVWDATAQPAVLRHDEARPFSLDPAVAPVDDPFHNVDISGGALAYESCCQETQELVHPPDHRHRLRAGAGGADHRVGRQRWPWCPASCCGPIAPRACSTPWCTVRGVGPPRPTSPCQRTPSPTGRCPSSPPPPAGCW